MNTKKVTLEFHDVRDGLPEKSGAYFVNTLGHNFTVLPYSSKHKAFNQCDCFEYTEQHTIYVRFWAELPSQEIFEDEGERENDDCTSEA